MTHLPIPKTGKTSAAPDRANSLFRNILHLSPSCSIFYADAPIPDSSNSIRNNILAPTPEKIAHALTPITPVFSIFCPQNIEPQGLFRDFPLTP